MFSAEQVRSFATTGYIIAPKFESLHTCELIRHELQTAMNEDLLKRPEVFDSGMVHNCFMRGATLRDHLSNKKLREATDELLCKNAIIYAYQSSSLPPGLGNYGSRIHVDCPRFISGYRTNIGYILALNPFTADSGGTWVLKGSHLTEKIPEQDEFERNAVQLTCNVGDAIFFDGRLVHRAGENKTEEWRHSITINFCRPYMRSRFDFPKLVGEEPWVKRLNDSARKFLGYDVRMPTSLEEFYLPQDKRLYMPNQE